MVAASLRQAFSRHCGAYLLSNEEESTTETRQSTEKTEGRRRHLQFVSVRNFERTTPFASRLFREFRMANTYRQFVQSHAATIGLLAVVTLVTTVTAEGKRHWSFRPLQQPAVPAVTDVSRVRTPVDRFVQAKLADAGFSLNRDAEFAKRLDRESPPDPRRRVRFAFERAAGRLPDDVELRQSLQFLEEQTRANEPAANAAMRAWSDFCQMLLAANAFLYVE